MSTQAEIGANEAQKRVTRGRRVLRWALGILATLVVLLALALGAVRVLLIQVPEYRDEIQAWVNDTTNLDVRFRNLDARWRIFGPELFATDAEVYAPGGGPLLAKAEAVSIGFDLGRALFRAELLAGRIRLIQPEINLVRTLDGRIELEGQAALDPSDTNRFNVDDLPTGLLEIVDARARFKDLKGEMGALKLDGVRVSVERDRNDVALEGDVELPEKLGQTLEFRGAAQGRLSTPEALQWSLEVESKQLQLSGWREFFGTLIRAPASGSGDLHLRAALTGRRLDLGTLDVDFQNVVLVGADGAQPPARYRTVAGKFEMSRANEELRVTGKDIDFSTAQHRWEPTRATVAWSAHDGSLARLDAEASFVQLESLLPLVTIAPKAAWRERALAFGPQGEVRNLRVTYARGAGEERAVTAAARLRDVGFEPVDKIPGLRGLNGELTLTPDSGRLSIDSTGMLFILPHVFRGPLSADLARGQIVWNREDTAWRVSTRQFQIRNAHVSTTAYGDLVLPFDKEVSPVLKLYSRFSDVVLVEGWRYLPVNKLHGGTLNWLDAAFLAGRAPSGEFVFDGPTRKFPFREDEGEFRVTFPVEGLKLHYAAGWPDIENMAADIEFRNEGLTGRVRGGNVRGLQISEGLAQFVDFKLGELTIKASAQGDLGDALGYLQTSPVGEGLGKQFMALRGGGATDLAIDLLLPVKNLQDRRIDVLANLSDAQVSLDGTRHALEQVRGAFRLRDREVSMPSGITASYLGGSIRVDAAPETAAGRIDNVVRVRAQTPAPALAQALEMPKAVGLEGMVDWRGLLRMPIQTIDQRGGRRTPSVRIDSTLRGTVIDLPAPFGKPGNTTQPVRIELQWPGSDELLVRASYGAEARAQLRLARESNAWEFARGTLRFGEGDIALPASAGLEVRGTLAALDLSEWFALGADNDTGTGKKSRRPLSAFLRSAELSVGELGLFGFEFPNVSASLLAGERAWSVKVDSPRARGNILVPYDFAGSEPLTLNLAKLTLGEAKALEAAPASRSVDEEEKEVDPRSWPSVRVSIAEFEAWGKKFGFLSADLVRVPEGLNLESFATKAATFALNGDGSWLMRPEGARGALKVKLESTDVLTTLQDLGYGTALSAKQGTIEADLTWDGTPSASLASRVVGNIRVEMNDGQLLSVQPGAGRVFGLMSVAALPRRLSLDFSDFFGKGLKFDSIRGDFKLHDGDAYTSNLLLKGPAAEIGVVGRTGLDSRDYDQTAVVTGSVGSSLPVVGALAGGPAVGAAVLVFSQIFKEPLKGIARGYYRITGPWENPTVVRVDKAEGKKTEQEVRTAEDARDAS